LGASYTDSVKTALKSLGLAGAAKSIYAGLGLARLQKALWARGIQRKYGATDRFEVCVRDLSWFLSTEDVYSKWWLLDRLEGGHIHEEGVTLRMLDALEGARCFADVGTNLGWYTCLASRALPEGTIHGFEMDELNFDLVRRNVEINAFPNTTIHHAAVTDAPGRVSYRRTSRGPSAGFRMAAGAEGAQAGELVSVQAITLDDFFRDAPTPPDVVKIDVEGAEMNVLGGMTELIERAAPTLFVEVHPQEIRNFGSSCEDVVGFLLDRGYEVFDIEDKGSRPGAPVRETRIERDTPLTQNTMLFARR
jgi:FkbM family methyltransferase